jgi:hypothetical protein
VLRLPVPANVVPSWHIFRTSRSQHQDSALSLPGMLNVYRRFLPLLPRHHSIMFSPAPSQGLSPQHPDAGPPQELPKVQREFITRHSSGTLNQTAPLALVIDTCTYAPGVVLQRLATPCLLHETEPGPAEILSLRSRAAGLLRGCEAFSPRAGNVPLHFHRQ